MSTPVQLHAANRASADAMIEALAPVSGFRFELTPAMVAAKWTPLQVEQELTRQVRAQEGSKPVSFEEWATSEGLRIDHLDASGRKTLENMRPPPARGSAFVDVQTLSKQVKKLGTIVASLRERQHDDAFFTECAREVLGRTQHVVIKETGRVILPAAWWAAFIATRHADDWIAEYESLEELLGMCTQMQLAYAKRVALL